MRFFFLFTVIFSFFFQPTVSLAMENRDGTGISIGSLVITDAWTRQTPPNARTGSAYLKITNNGSEVDTLTGGAATFVRVVEIHDMSMTDGIMSMFPLTEGLQIAPGETVALEPGGKHIMMMGITHHFSMGQTVMIRLDFEKAGSVDVAFPVGRLGAKEGPHHHEHHHHRN